ncbi:hypothetical protein DICPUDRAFT_157609 [Dictyostelium purpureum]|uniref:Isochorismatase-like domain-containing protein n=1 Tax=Dictyostelium purpureum TaxID=5786 RepID=F0ZZK0_DICPU|nr:uncharacterized protein DICPUDRAFT_157609 [Dictyostelium purpureum]EGC30639.1 hypothetical protein DICPUDRAFT_157609 [Dictyostelium purpureum]|eukprot:XP_003292845.1 hypothetical protein DICPUDRAFT_157609 [Dictyostelium purpureum]
MKALIMVDMLNDFVDGAIANQENANKIIPKIQQLLEHARNNPDWLIVYANDLHTEKDREMEVWGPHAMEGTKGAEVIEALKPTGLNREIISPKKFYGAFDQTNLDEELKKFDKVDEVVITGQHTNCCIRHTSYNSFMRNYIITVPSDCVCLYKGTEADNTEALKYLKDIYGARITTSEEILKSN